MTLIIRPSRSLDCMTPSKITPELNSEGLNGLVGIEQALETTGVAAAKRVAKIRKALDVRTSVGYSLS